MPKLKQRKDDLFRAWYKGKQFYGKTQAEAIRLRDEYKYQCEHGIEQIRPKSVYEFSAEWLPVSKAGVATRTYNQYAGLIDRLNGVVGDKLMSAVTPQDIKAVWKQYVGKSQSMIHKASFLYRSLFQAGIENGYCRVNPMDAETAMPHKGTKGTHRTLSWEEIDLILKTPHRCQNAAAFMLLSGIRRGEALALRKADIYDGRIHVHRAVSFTSNAPIVKDTKNESSMREIPLFDALNPFYEAVPDGAYILPSHDGTMCSETAFSRAWESYLSELSAQYNGCPKRWWHLTHEWKQEHPEEYQRYLSLKQKNKAEAEEYRLIGWRDINFTPHDLRHTFVSRYCRDKGVDLHVCMEWCGHSSERMILQIYDHVSEEREQSAIDLVNGTVKKQLNGCVQNAQSEENQRFQA